MKIFDVNKTKKYAKDLEKIIRDAWIDQEVRVGLDGNNIILKHDSGEQYVINLDEYIDPELKKDSDSPVSPKFVYFSRNPDCSHAICRCGQQMVIGEEKCPSCNRVIDWGQFFKRDNK